MNTRVFPGCAFGRARERQGRGLAQAVRAQSPATAERFEHALGEALAAIDAVGAPFRVALIEDRPALERVYEAVRALKQGIQMELASALGASIGFGFSDTD